MFHSTRIKLTAWYLLIIMAISIAFSAFIYLSATSEFDRILRMQRYRIEHPEYRVRILQNAPVQIEQLPAIKPPDLEVITEARNHILLTLLAVNSLILVWSALAGYFLAGRTLRPIKQMLDDQNRFITDASHELNTPLTSLRTSMEVTLRDKHLTITKAKHVLASNLEEVTSLQTLSDELIKLTKYEEHHHRMVMGHIQVDKLLTAALRTVHIIAEHKNITITYTPTDITVIGNTKTLTDLFVILLDNAVKYSPEKTTITITAEQTDHKGVITITDQGIGIDATDLPHIFDRFYRTDKSRTKQHIAGYGLGLSIAKRIVDEHKGTITAISNVGEGSTFSVTLPII